MRKTSPDIAIDLLQQAPAIRKLVPFIAVDRPDEERAVIAQTVDMELFQPHQRIVMDVAAHLLPAIVRPGAAPGGLGAPVVIKIDAALVVLLPAVELPEVQVAGTKVVVDHVQDHGQAALVCLPYEGLEAIRSAVGALHGIDVGRVVAPGIIPGELGHRHDLDGIDAQALQMLELFRGILKVSGFSLCIGKE